MTGVQTCALPIYEADDALETASDDRPTARDSNEDAVPEATEIAESAATTDGGDVPTDVAAELRTLDLAHLTPVEALTELDRLKQLLEE